MLPGFQQTTKSAESGLMKHDPANQRPLWTTSLQHLKHNRRTWEKCDCSPSIQPIDCQSAYALPCDLKRVYQAAVAKSVTAVKPA